MDTTINAVIIKDEERREAIVGFSGTKSTDQLVDEITRNFPTKYALHDIEGALVLDFFQREYAQFRDWMLWTLAEFD